MDENAASRAALNLQEAGYSDVRVVVRGLNGLFEEAEKRGMNIREKGAAAVSA